MMFNTKIVVVLRDDLAPWQCANVTAFLSGGIASDPNIIGKPYADATGREYLPLLRQPVFVFEGNADELKRTYDRAISREIAFSIFPNDIFATNNDDDNRGAVLKLNPESFNLAGLAFHTDAKIADKVTSGLKRHR
ncbi:MAG: DUF2000 domain-containing protein [bacterium]|nr:DUF2000 domain-containing protein [bacterium]